MRQPTYLCCGAPIIDIVEDGEELTVCSSCDHPCTPENICRHCGFDKGCHNYKTMQCDYNEGRPGAVEWAETRFEPIENNIMKHTKEPWSLDGFNITQVITSYKVPDPVHDNVFKHTALFNCNAYKGPQNDPDACYAENIENAARIVTCVNAMAGLTNEQVEGLRGLVKELTEVCEDALNTASEDMYFDMISAIKLKETINKAKEIINEPVENIPETTNENLMNVLEVTAKYCGKGNQTADKKAGR